ncbi:MAG: type II toxin-antitoxin system RelE/ParE family toxin [Firmicutes bacterium]|nr:type II toxin-antitoxin system RelE/ParE family toxin [Bacillota bacterium]
MKREFVMTEWFDASWKEQNLSDENLRMLQGELLHNPKCGDVIRGTGGFRKMRFALPDRGKSGGLRVIYLDIQDFETLYLMLAYPKNEKDTLSDAECAELKQISANIKNNLMERKRKGKDHV